MIVYINTNETKQGGLTKTSVTKHWKGFKKTDTHRIQNIGSRKKW